jgi:antitoxin component of MazEF toxin-antitoxin module
MQIRRVFKQGGSRAVSLPSVYANTLKLRPGSYVRFSMDKNWRLVLEPVRETKGGLNGE